MLRSIGRFAATALFLALPAFAQVRIVVGPTPIPGGQARSAGDITLVNDKLAAAIAVTTAPPWAIPRGALIDAAPVTEGVIGRDRIAFADFLPDSWSAWPSTDQHVSIVTDTPGPGRGQGGARLERGGHRNDLVAQGRRRQRPHRP